MKMDAHHERFSVSTNEIQFGNQSLPVLHNQRFSSTPIFQNSSFFDQSRDFDYLQCDPIQANTSSSSTVTHEEQSPEDCDFSDAVLSYISQILMEEDMEDKTCMLQDSLDLQSAERSFYDVLGEKYPPNNQNDGVGGNLPLQNLQGNNVSHSPYSSGNSVISSTVDSSSSNLQVPDLSSENQSIWQFHKGVEEASKFLPSGNELFANFNPLEPKVGVDEWFVKVEKDEGEDVLDGYKGRRYPDRDEEDVEENRSRKQAAIYSEPTLRSSMIDIILLHSAGDGKKHYVARRDALQNKTNKIMMPSGKSKPSNGGKGHSKKQIRKNKVIDLRTLLVLCAQALAADDYSVNTHFCPAYL